MSSLGRYSGNKNRRNGRAVAFSGVLVVLTAGILWFVTDGFTDGKFASLSAPVITTATVVGALLGFLDASSFIDGRLESLHGDSVLARSIVGGVVGLTAIVLYNALDVQPVEALLAAISFFVAGFVGRAYYVFVK